MALICKKCMVLSVVLENKGSGRYLRKSSSIHHQVAHPCLFWPHLMPSLISDSDFLIRSVDYASSGSPKVRSWSSGQTTVSSPSRCPWFSSVLQNHQRDRNELISCSLCPQMHKDVRGGLLSGPQRIQQNQSAGHHFHFLRLFTW